MVRTLHYLARPWFILWFLFAVALRLWILPRGADRLIWGPAPIINNKYWSEAMRRSGWRSETLMETVYDRINSRADFDLYFSDLTPRVFRGVKSSRWFGRYFSFLHILKHAKVVHLPFSGGPLGSTLFWRLEAIILRRANIRIVMSSYGSDYYRYSTIVDATIRNGLLISYPGAARKEARVRKRVEYWNKHADAVLLGSMLEGAARWDVTLPSHVVVDTAEWRGIESYSRADGTDGAVRIIHTPNHRGAKGSEFVIAAVERLRSRGLSIELILLEGVSNEEVKRALREADILVEQLVLYGYGMSGIEGMATGLPVMTNLSLPAYSEVHRRYAFLEECPAVSTTIDDVAANLEALIRNPDLRETLGRAGRAYVEKYHSFEMAQYLFGSIYRKIVDGEDIDLMNLFHPLKSEFNRRLPVIGHPLERSRLPAGLCNRTMAEPADSQPAAAIRVGVS